MIISLIFLHDKIKTIQSKNLNLLLRKRGRIVSVGLFDGTILYSACLVYKIFKKYSLTKMYKIKRYLLFNILIQLL